MRLTSTWRWFTWTGQSLEAAEQAAALAPLSAGSHTARGRALLKLGRRGEARQAFRQALEYDPGKLPVRADLAKLCFGMRRYEEAREQYLAILRQVPDHFATQIWLCETAIRLGRLNEAGDVLEAARGLHLTTPMSLPWRGGSARSQVMISKEGKEGSGIRRPPQRALGAWATLLLLAVLHLFSGCRNGRQTQALNDANEPWFEEVSKRAGIDLIQHSGRKGKYLFPEISFGGLGLCDFDGDGFLDIYFLQGHPLHEKTAEGDTNQLYRNRGDGTFEDVTTAARVGDSGYGMGCACGDYDNDGDVDLYVTNLGPNVLYENQGDGTFSEVTKAAGVGDSSWGASAAFVDYDQDQDLDLFVVNYVNWLPEHELQCVSTGGLPDYCSPNNYQAHARDTLYRNNGDGTFTDVSRQAGLSTAFGNGFGIAPGDYNGDTLMDFYVANDGMPNQLWINQGDGTFTEEALMSGCAVSRDGIAEAGMGVTGVDIESDGDLDLFIDPSSHRNQHLLSQRGIRF